MLNTFLYYSRANTIALIYFKKIFPLSTDILFGLQLDWSKIFWKPLVIVIPILSFKGTTRAYLLKISIICYKKRIIFLNLLINSISARSAPQILSIKDQRTFRFSNFLIIGPCNSLTNSWFDILSFLIVPPANLFCLARVANVSDRARVAALLAPKVFLSKIYKPLKQDHVDIHHILDFEQYWIFYHVIFYQKLFF